MSEDYEPDYQMQAIVREEFGISEPQITPPEKVELVILVVGYISCAVVLAIIYSADWQTNLFRSALCGVGLQLYSNRIWERRYDLDKTADLGALVGRIAVAGALVWLYSAVFVNVWESNWFLLLWPILGVALRFLDGAISFVLGYAVFFVGVAIVLGGAAGVRLTKRLWAAAVKR